MKDRFLRVIQFDSPSHPVTPTGNRENSGLRKRPHLKYILTLISLLLVVSIALSPGTRAAGITEYSLPPGSTKPYGIAVDDKPSTSYVWVAIYGSDKIGRLDPSLSDILEFQLPTGSRPWDIAYDNYTDSKVKYRVWFTESQRHRIGVIDQVDTSFRLLEFYLIDGAGPRGIALQYGHVPNSSYISRVWFTEFGIGAIGALTWDDARDELFVTQWYLPDSNCQPLDIIYLNTTGVWFTEYQGHRIGNFNPVTGELREWPLPPGSYPWGIANDTYGNIWFTESGRNRIGKLNPYTNEITEYYIPTPGAQPYEIVIDRYNNVWFTEHGTNRIGRFSPGTNTLVEFERKSGGAPWGIAYAYAGAYQDEIWFTEEVGNRIGRIDDTVAKTTVTVTSKYVIATQSTTATTLGSSVTSTSTGTTNATYIFTAAATTTNTTETQASYTSYRVTETSSFLKTSSVAESTSTATYTATTTLTATSYVTTIYETTSITATTTKVETSLTSITATSTLTSYIATLTATGTVTSTSTVTMTSYQYATTTPWPMIPGYSPPSIILGLALGLAVMSAPVIFKGWRRLKHSGWLAAMLAVFLILVVTMAPAAQAALITEWKLPPGSTMPYGMTFDDQSPYRVWFVEFGSDKIGRLDHVSGEIFEIIIPSTSQPWGIVFEPANHEIWFTMSGRHRLGVVKGYGNSIFELVLPDGSQPRGIAIQGHVNGTDYPYIWIALYGSDQIARVDPYYDQKIVYWDLDPGAKPQSIIFVPDTGVWFTEDGPGKIGNLNPATGEVKEWEIPDNGKAWALASDSYGFIWFTDYANDRLGRLNPYTGEIILYGIPTSSSQPYGIAIDSKGDVWFAEHAQNRLGRFSPDSLTFEEFVRPTGGSVWGVAISEDGKIWFTDDAGNKICRLDPSQALATTTVSEISTASKITTTEVPSSTLATSAVSTTTKYDVSTTRTTAPTTVTTTYGLTETVKVLKTSTTTSTTSYIPTTVTVLGDLTTTVTNTVSTHTVTSTTPYTSTTYTYTTVTGTSTTTKYTTVTTTTTSTTTVTTAFGFGMIPGYSTASMLIGLITGAASLAILNLRRLKRR